MPAEEKSPEGSARELPGGGSRGETGRHGRIDPIGPGAAWGLGYLTAGLLVALLVYFVPTLYTIHADENLLPFVGIVILWPFLLLFHLTVLFGDPSEYPEKIWLLLWLLPFCALLLCGLRARGRRGGGAER